jgi:GTP-binding protein
MPIKPDGGNITIDYAELAATAVKPEQFPTDGRPEVVFAGKSNVGKSSLINAMVNRKALVRVSQNPGKTRTLNFFDVEHLLYFVDVPGYGYARVAKSEAAKWGPMIEGYLKERSQIKLMLMLLDIRHEPGAHDRTLYEWCLYYKLPLAIVATKSDKLKKSQLQKNQAVIRRALDLPEPPLAFSSETQHGRDELWALIMDRCGLT